MGQASIATVGEGLSIRLPEEIADRLHLRAGDQVTIEGKGPVILVRCAGEGHREPRAEFSDALKELRARVREAGGISQEEIDEAIRAAREGEADRLG